MSRPAVEAAAGPSSLYRVGLWRWGLRLARALPAGVVRGAAGAVSAAYAAAHPSRLDVVRRNLLPVFDGDAARADRAARRCFREFGIKLADLWRYEAGLPVDAMFRSTAGWEHFLRAREDGRGVLLVTPHLGNWEFGAPLLAARGVKLLVLTQEEPGQGFTEHRRAARARWGIETLVVGSDPFAFVEILRRLQEGAVVALLMDRPPAASAVSVTFFGRSFQASVSAAELARASGCAVLPVLLPRVAGGYEAHLLPPITYDRRALGKREERIRFTGEILRVFEPGVRQHADQWFHFVPLWDGPGALPSVEVS